eukprot:GEMP01095063.1.p1 GENE.GEMP01095063.1~~GEMP01095063.1.p1  ORF type:complete len:228 (+),score=40.43 GEMP01095063.1:160-843(+)
MIHSEVEELLTQHGSSLAHKVLERLRKDTQNEEYPEVLNVVAKENEMLRAIGVRLGELVAEKHKSTASVAVQADPYATVLARKEQERLPDIPSPTSIDPQYTDDRAANDIEERSAISGYVSSPTRRDTNRPSVIHPGPPALITLTSPESSDLGAIANVQKSIGQPSSSRGDSPVSLTSARNAETMDRFRPANSLSLTPITTTLFYVLVFRTLAGRYICTLNDITRTF